MNWYWVMQAGSAIATYVALVGAYLVGYSPLEFALLTAVLLSLWLSLYSIASSKKPASRPEQSINAIVPSLSESMSELRSLQREINTLQAQFAARTKTQRNASDDAAE